MPMTKFDLDDFREFAQFPTIIFAKFDEKGFLVSINDEITNTLGWRPEEILGHSFTEFLSTPDFETFSIAPSFQNGRFRHKNGEWKTILWMAKKKDGQYLVIGREVTQIKEFEDALRLSSERLSLAVNIGGVGTFEWWPAKGELYPDENAERIYGYERGTMGRDASFFGSFVLDEDLPSVSSEVMAAAREVRRYTLEYRILRRDGELRWLKVWGQPIVEADGQLRVIGMFLDNTDLKLASEEQRLLSRVSEILSSSFDYVKNIQEVLALLTRHICDMGYVDHRAEDLTTNRIEVRKVPGTSDVKVTSKTFPGDATQSPHPIITRLYSGEVVHIPNVDQLVDELREDYSDEYLENVKAHDTKSNLVVLLRRHDHMLGAFVVGLNRNNKRNFSERDIHIIREISYRISMAMENSLLYISSQEAVHARDEFLSIASHELKTPLQSLTLQNEMLTRQLERCPDEKLNQSFIRRSLEGDRRQLTRITRLIEDMLDITRIQNSRMSIERGLVDFTELLYEVVERMRPAFDAQGMRLTLNADSGIIIHADAFRIEQVITNILTNALKYGDNGPVNVKAMCEGGRLSFSVTDQGQGIKKEDQKRIFQRFERAGTRNGISGLGLGLYICQKIVEAHDGQIFVESEPERGATFTISLPLR